LLEIDFREVTFEVIDNGILGVVRIEIGVSVYELNFKWFAEKFLEFEQVGGHFEVDAGELVFVAVL
jgi:hypothetical protein